MPDIHIVREHQLGLAGARKLAFKWAETAEAKLGMECAYEEGRTHDTVTFTRSGVNGELHVGKDKFQLDARLGLVLGAFKGRIETEIVKNLDLLLAQEDPHKAWDEALGRHERGEAIVPRHHEGKHAAKPAKKKKA